MRGSHLAVLLAYSSTLSTLGMMRPMRRQEPEPREPVQERDKDGNIIAESQDMTEEEYRELLPAKATRQQRRAAERAAKKAMKRMKRRVRL